ncbi:Hypothetical predicted protein [Mytilus galloprovincialis]|uniref:LEM domain-containing protein n=1 Tax=Mytilus galloprovincialis TaxID=29158 RepID=A0A8B6DWD2_MYTGA|nr:Hypothetical predicted protein [Mytilus galloprovincialis]VDI26149.1 Hypothetical predicted protein [Mytilus galloprovincialis]
MGPIRRSGTRTNVHYDPEMPENWTLVKLRQELNTRGIRIPPNTRRMALVRLYRESRENISSDAGRNNESHAITILGSARSQNATATDTTTDHVHDAILGSARSQNATATDTTTDHVHDALLGSAASQDASVETNNRTLINIVSRLSTTVQSLQQNVTTLTGQVNTLITQRTVDAREQTKSTTITGNTGIPTFGSTGNQRSEVNGLNFNLETAYSALKSNALPTAAAGSEEQALRNNRYVQTSRGYSAESLPFVETVTPQLRRNIISGMDINLSSLLIPYYVGMGTTDGEDKSENSSYHTKPDPRLNRSLNIGEFIQAFGIYKNVMCSTFPHRRSELDTYERDIVDMASRYPGNGFYEYHRRFSLDSAAHLRYNNMAVDWSIRNNTLFCNIFTNIRPNTCNNCGSTFHTSGFCSATQRSSGNKINDSQDTYGRERVFHSGREICNNFNGHRGCILPRCRNAHVCLACKGDHPKINCQQTKNEFQGPQKNGPHTQRRN